MDEMKDFFSKNQHKKQWSVRQFRISNIHRSDWQTNNQLELGHMSSRHSHEPTNPASQERTNGQGRIFLSTYLFSCLSSIRLTLLTALQMGKLNL